MKKLFISIIIFLPLLLQAQNRADQPLVQSNYSWDDNKQDWKQIDEIFYEYDLQGRRRSDTRKFSPPNLNRSLISGKSTWQYDKRGNQLIYENNYYGYNWSTGVQEFRNYVAVQQKFNSNDQMTEQLSTNQYFEFDVLRYTDMNRRIFSYDDKGNVMEELNEAAYGDADADLTLTPQYKRLAEWDNEGRMTRETYQSFNDQNWETYFQNDFEYLDGKTISRGYRFASWDGAWTQVEFRESSGSKEAEETISNRWYVQGEMDTVFIRLTQKYNSDQVLTEQTEEFRRNTESIWRLQYERQAYYNFQNLLTLERVSNFFYDENGSPTRQFINFSRHSYDENDFLIETRIDNRATEGSATSFHRQSTRSYTNDCDGTPLEYVDSFSKNFIAQNPNSSLPPDTKSSFQYTPIPPCDEPSADIELKVYPNPARDYILIESNLFYFPETELELYDSFGRFLMKGDQRISLYRQLDLSTLSSGSYFLQLKKGDEVLVKKILVLR